MAGPRVKPGDDPAIQQAARKVEINILWYNHPQSLKRLLNLRWLAVTSWPNCAMFAADRGDDACSV
jgi:hypothetical protein